MSQYRSPNWAKNSPVKQCIKVDKTLAVYIFFLTLCNDIYNDVGYIMIKSKLFTPKINFKEILMSRDE